MRGETKFFFFVKLFDFVGWADVPISAGIWEEIKKKLRSRVSFHLSCDKKQRKSMRAKRNQRRKRKKWYNIRCLNFLSTLVHIGSFRSTLVLFCPLRSYSVHIGPRSILSTLVFLVQSIHFGPVCYFSPVWSILSTLVLICPFNLIRSILVLFSLLRSHLILLVPIWSIQTISVHFDPLRSIFVHLHNGKRHVWVESTYSKYKFIIKKI